MREMRFAIRLAIFLTFLNGGVLASLVTENLNIDVSNVIGPQQSLDHIVVFEVKWNISIPPPCLCLL